MIEHLKRDIGTIDGPATRIFMTLIESDARFFVSIKIGAEVHVVDASEFHFVADDFHRKHIERLKTT